MVVLFSLLKIVKLIGLIFAHKHMNENRPLAERMRPHTPRPGVYGAKAFSRGWEYTP